jgi:hypothetical protein
VNVTTPEFNNLRKELVSALLTIPGIEDFNVRTSLLYGLPPLGLNRSQGDARLDLNGILVGLGNVGRLLDQGGARPLVVVIDNALERIPESSELGVRLKALAGRMAELYGGDTQPAPAQADAVSREALIFGLQRDTRLSFTFLEGALRTVRSVARLAVPRFFGGSRSGETMFGTGWLIAPGVLITNHHVIDARDRRPRPWGAGEAPAAPADFTLQGGAVEVWFDYHVESSVAPTATGGALLAHHEALDYALIELREEDKGKIADRPPLPVLAERSPLAPGARLNIAQHPNGGALRLAIRNNFYVKSGATSDFVRYQTDTEPGASGSPVCDDRWNVVALHHASVAVPKQTVPQEVLQGQPVEVQLLNEAVTLSAVLASLPADVRRRLVL